MAKSFHNTIQEWQDFEIDHLGESVSLRMPKCFGELSGTLENGTLKTMDKQTLLNWIDKHDCVLPVLHSAFAKRYIDLRAVARPQIKNFKSLAVLEEYWSKLENPNDYHKILSDSKGKPVFKISKKITKDLTEAQKRIDNAEWEVIKPSGEGNNKKLVMKEIETLMKSIQTMLDLGLDIDVIKPKLLEKHNEQIVTMAIEMLR